MRCRGMPRRSKHATFPRAASPTPVGRVEQTEDVDPRLQAFPLQSPLRSVAPPVEGGRPLWLSFTRKFLTLPRSRGEKAVDEIALPAGITDECLGPAGDNAANVPAAGEAKRAASGELDPGAAAAKRRRTGSINAGSIRASPPPAPREPMRVGQRILAGNVWKRRFQVGIVVVDCHRADRQGTAVHRRLEDVQQREPHRPPPPNTSVPGASFPASCLWK